MKERIYNDAHEMYSLNEPRLFNKKKKRNANLYISYIESLTIKETSERIRECGLPLNFAHNSREVMIDANILFNAGWPCPKIIKENNNHNCWVQILRDDANEIINLAYWQFNIRGK
jgi:hypothetical protein